MSLESPTPRRSESIGSLDPVGAFELPVNVPVLCVLEYEIAEPERARLTSYSGAQFGMIDVFRYDGFGVHRGDRSLSHIRADRMDDYLISIPLRARIDISQSDVSGSLEPGNFSLLATSKPFTAQLMALSRGETFSALNVRVSGAVLRQRIPDVDKSCGRALRLRAGAGTILKQMCELAVSEARSLSPAEGRRFGTMLVDAVTNAAAEAPEILALREASSSSAYQRIGRQARAYIENHLDDPGLSTEIVAAHCRVSKRYLQAVFADLGETVGATIRELRLQRCREALRSPALRRHSVACIAMRWGFSDMPYFCRAYKSRFDMPPSKDREPTTSRSASTAMPPF